MKIFEGLDYETGDAIRLTLDGNLIVERSAIAASAGLPKLYPALADNHCHILPTGLDMQKLWLGALSTKDDVLDAIRQRASETEPGDWVLAVHYDQTKFADGNHLTIGELDAISAELPILIRHVNGHASVGNSIALKAAKVDKSTANPPGGEYVRDASGAFTGLLLESAHERVTAAIPNPSVDQMVKAICEAGKAMAAYGIAGAADMMTGRYDLAAELEAYRRASEEGCPISLRLYLQWSTVFGPRCLPADKLRELSDAMNPSKCRVAGIKIFADGAIGSRTAAIYGQFEGSDGTIDEGTLIYAPNRLKAMVKSAHDAGYQVAIHTIGDRSSDLVMDAFAATDEPSRHRIEHIMIMSDAQLDRLASLECHATFQPEFLSAFGHSYKRQLGEARASKLIRIRSTQKAGIPLSLSSDRPIVSGDPHLAMKNASQRPDGYDPNESISMEEAIRAHTAMGWIGMGDTPSFAPGSQTGVFQAD